jgi:hypothetical protein
LVVPLERVTFREAVLPFGPVVLELTLPACRVAVRVAVRPPAPVTVVLRVRCANALLESSKIPRATAEI